MGSDRIGSIAEIVGVAVSLLGIALTLLVERLKRPKTELSCFLNAPVSLLSIRSDIEGRAATLTSSLKVLYGETSVGSVALLQAQLRNTGSQSLRRDQLYDPVKLVFSEQVTILEAQVQRVHPPTMQAQINSEAHEAEIVFDLMNPGDTIEAVLVLTPMTSSLPTVTARVEGSSQVRVLTSKQPGTTSKQLLSYGVLLLLLYFGLRFSTDIVKYFLLALDARGSGLSGGSIFVAGLLFGFAVAGLLGFILNRMRLASRKVRRYSAATASPSGDKH